MRIMVKDKTGFVRDPQTMAILSVDMELVDRHKMKMMQLQKERYRDEEINTIKAELADIRTMMQQFLTMMQDKV